jgi:hypothetical protein
VAISAGISNGTIWRKSLQGEATHDITKEEVDVASTSAAVAFYIDFSELPVEM